MFELKIKEPITGILLFTNFFHRKQCSAEQDVIGDGKNTDSLDSLKKIGRVLCISTKAEGYTGNSKCLTGLSLRLNIYNRILKVSFFIPLTKYFISQASYTNNYNGKSKRKNNLMNEFFLDRKGFHF